MFIKLKTGEHLMMSQVEMLQACGAAVCIRMASGSEFVLPVDSEEKAHAMVEILVTKMAERLGTLHG